MACASYDIFLFSGLNIQKGRNITMSGFDTRFKCFGCRRSDTKDAALFYIYLQQNILYSSNGFCIKLSTLSVLAVKMRTLIFKTRVVYTSTTPKSPCIIVNLSVLMTDRIREWIEFQFESNIWKKIKYGKMCPQLSLKSIFFCLHLFCFFRNHYYFKKYGNYLNWITEKIALQSVFWQIFVILILLCKCLWNGNIW